MKVCGIYKIQSKKKPERIYIGSSVHIYSRWSKHKGDLRRNQHDNGRLQNHANKYGVDDLSFSIITGCGEDVVIAYEQFYIDALNPWFNLAPVAGSTRGIIHESRRGVPTWRKGKSLTEEHKRKISESMSGEKNHQYGKPSPRKGGEGYPSPFKGKKGRYSEETLQKTRISNQRAWDRRRAERALKIKEEQLCQE